jgi:hypothetical protein
MQARFGHDFRNVRVHRDAAADDAAHALAASAFTVGTDIVFRAGHYAPETPDGLSLVAHELAHVVQNERNPVSSRDALSAPMDSSEREAEEASREVSAGSPTTVENAPSGVIARSCLPWDADPSPDVRTGGIGRILEQHASGLFSGIGERAGGIFNSVTDTLGGVVGDSVASMPWNALGTGVDLGRRGLDALGGILSAPPGSFLEGGVGTGRTPVRFPWEDGQ